MVSFTIEEEKEKERGRMSVYKDRIDS
jgi:hypothetical protein